MYGCYLCIGSFFFFFFWKVGLLHYIHLYYATIYLCSVRLCLFAVCYGSCKIFPKTQNNKIEMITSSDCGYMVYTACYIFDTHRTLYTYIFIHQVKTTVIRFSLFLFRNFVSLNSHCEHTRKCIRHRVCMLHMLYRNYV